MALRLFEAGCTHAQAWLLCLLWGWLNLAMAFVGASAQIRDNILLVRSQFSRFACGCFVGPHSPNSELLFFFLWALVWTKPSSSTRQASRNVKPTYLHTCWTLLWQGRLHSGSTLRAFAASKIPTFCFSRRWDFDSNEFNEKTRLWS